VYKERRDIIDAMEAAGLKVLVSDGLYYAEYVAAYHNSRIGLCYSPQQSAMFRIFETAAMGCVVLSNPIRDYEQLGNDGIVIFPHDRPDVAALYAKQLADDPHTAQRLIGQSLAWVKPHTWDARAGRILGWWMINQERLHDTATV
jgi:hypothetical protein